MSSRPSSLTRDELHEMKEQEMSSRLRAVFGPLLCIFGLHNWGPPKAQNSLVLHGEKQDDGTWEHWTEDPSKSVSQYCQSCPKYRDREDLDWNALAAIQRGESPETSHEHTSNP